MAYYVYMYFVNFSIQLFLMEFIFTIGISKRKNFFLKMVAIGVIYFVLGIPVIEIVHLVPDEFYLLSALYYLTVYGISIFIITALYQVYFSQAMFIGTAGYAAQHIVYSFSNLIGRLILDQFVEPGGIISNLFQYMVFLLAACLFYFILQKPNTHKGELKTFDLRMVFISLAVLCTSSFLSVFVENYSRNEMSILVPVSRIYAIMSCLLGLLMQFDISKRNKLETSNEMLQELVHMEKRQHEISKQTVEMINIKCHDLKYQLKKFENMDNKELQKEKIRNLQKDVMIYDSVVQTGNDVLDLVLTEKSLLCKEYNIKLSYILDGALMKFMDATDLYVLFSNIMDNAIESVVQEPISQRLISINLYSHHQMIFVHAENACSRILEFQNGLPVTTKQDKKYHGFGTRSIQNIVKKYDGNMLMKQKANKFTLEMLFQMNL